MEDRLHERVEALERAVTDGETDLSALADGALSADRIAGLESRLEDLETEVAELDAASQALRGYVGQIRAVNEEVETTASLALAKIEDIEDGATRLGDHETGNASVAPGQSRDPTGDTSGSGYGAGSGCNSEPVASHPQSAHPGSDGSNGDDSTSIDINQAGPDGSGHAPPCPACGTTVTGPTGTNSTDKHTNDAVEAVGGPGQKRTRGDGRQEGPTGGRDESDPPEPNGDTTAHAEQERGPVDAGTDTVIGDVDLEGVSGPGPVGSSGLQADLGETPPEQSGENTGRHRQEGAGERGDRTDQRPGRNRFSPEPTGSRPGPSTQRTRASSPGADRQATDRGADPHRFGGGSSTNSDPLVGETGGVSTGGSGFADIDGESVGTRPGLLARIRELL